MEKLRENINKQIESGEINIDKLMEGVNVNTDLLYELAQEVQEMGEFPPMCDSCVEDMIDTYKLDNVIKETSLKYYNGDTEGVLNVLLTIGSSMETLIEKIGEKVLVPDVSTDI